MDLQKLIIRNLHQELTCHIWECETLRLTMYYKNKIGYYYKNGIGYQLQLDYLPNPNNKNVIKHIAKTYLDEFGNPINEKYQAKFDRIEQMLEPYVDFIIESTVDNALFRLAWDYLNNCTYFAKPYRNSDGKIISFSNEFQYKNYIGNCDKGLYIECGCLCLENETFYHDPSLTVIADTFEQAVIKLYNKVHKRCGEDYIDDYFHVDDIDNLQDCMYELPNGNYGFNSKDIKSHWEVDKVLEKLKKYEEEMPSI